MRELIALMYLRTNAIDEGVKPGVSPRVEDLMDELRVSCRDLKDRKSNVRSLTLINGGKLN
ncbi:MAG: hypothetical protein EOP09_00230 [Proteobacteria bacterium]|nr:MAG: hypothetical protein EOP09_00230 [Pseudomonadota bacterium]